jgi:NADPH:quinone reductase-like Zn-dependent oxidoreductase
MKATIGSDFAGKIEAVGSAVRSSKEGDKVVGFDAGSNVMEVCAVKMGPGPLVWCG